MPNDKHLIFPRMSKHLWIWMGVLLCVSAWMFFLGVLVGRGTSPVKFDIKKLERKLMAKRLAAEQKEKAAVASNLEKGPDKTELKFYEDLKKKRTEDKLQAVEIKKEKSEVAKPAPPPPKPSAKPTKKESTAGLYTVQVASLRSKTSAHSIAEKLVQKGFDAFVASSSSTNTGIWYRVRIGNYKTKKDALNMAQKMVRESFKPIVVRRQ